MLAEDRRSVLENGCFSTQEVHQGAVERVIQTMHTHLCEPLILEDMADIACLSPYYFSRVFHQVVGIPPGEFLATLRLDRAKQLLLTTSLSITDICFEVGYVGLGSFTTRFTQQVGVSPRQLRNLAREGVATFFRRKGTHEEPAPMFHHAGVRGHIHTLDPFKGLIFAGLFPKAIPQGQPTRCTLLVAPGPYTIRDVPDGRYFLLVAALPVSENLHTYLLPQEGILVGVAGPLVVRHGTTQAQVDLVLRAPCLTDPPIISALPFI
ncbi:MAG TPA: helix-turn-helix transcriptional regulator [Ktedonobacteraceae bacterium]